MFLYAVYNSRRQKYGNKHEFKNFWGLTFEAHSYGHSKRFPFRHFVLFNFRQVVSETAVNPPDSDWNF